MKDEWFIVGNGSDAETISFSEFRYHRTQVITFQDRTRNLYYTMENFITVFNFNNVTP